MTFTEQLEVLEAAPAATGKPNVAEAIGRAASKTFMESLPDYMIDASAYRAEEDPYLYKGSPVDWSTDLKRIVEIPRRTLNDEDPRAAVVWTKHLRRHRTDQCDCDERWGERYPDDHDEFALR